MSDLMNPWTTCVVLAWKPRTETDGGWWAAMRWSWGKFCDPEMVEGEIRTRYPTGMRRAIDQVMAMAARFGVEAQPTVGMSLFVEGDGEGDQLLPAGWRSRVIREAARRGWESYEPEEADNQKETE
jgi:hypothetical protein